MANGADPVCCHCKLPITPNAPRWTAHEPQEFWHYKCAEESGLADGKRLKAVFAARPYRAD